MKLILKTLEKYNRSMYIYYPEGKPRSPFRRFSVTILREASDEASVKHLLDVVGLAKMAEENQIILSFPNPTEAGWNYELDESGPNDMSVLLDMQDSIDVDREIEPKQKPAGIPSFEMMTNSWHPMNDSKFFVGVGSGASMALAMAACHPHFIAAVLAVGGSLPQKALQQAAFAPMPVYLVNATDASVEYFRKVNDALESDGNTYYCSYNPLQKVITEAGQIALTGGIFSKAWNSLFKKCRRPNTGKLGDIEPRLDFEKAGFEIFLEDTRLGDQNALPHTWFTHVPSSVKANPGKKVPMLMFFHGGSDNPYEAADMSKFHELGETEGFITVYPWGSNRASWNVDMSDSGLDDVGFAVALINYMKENYPVDGERVYLSGFSNGAALAQIVAMVHPELIAAICHIDANWPGERLGPSDVDYNTIKPMALAMKKKESYDFRIPVWYTYGNREPSYPVYAKCTQQHQYDFWKKYNNITIKPTPGRDNPHPCGCGVPGDKYELLKVSKRHPHHEYDVQRFYTNDEKPENYYNYVMMRDKGHDIAQMDPYLGWNYVKQFKRNPDGSVGKV